jgi:xanthine dehydrogenase small subunit
VLRHQLGITSVKDGCSPQGQCGCCTVWVDGAPRVACVTPARRLEGREITTLDGLPEPVRRRWAEALVATGGSQCGFCTPGILMRLAALTADDDGPGPSPDDVDRALLAHLCRCTGWQTIEEAARLVSAGWSDPAASLDPVAVTQPTPAGPTRPDTRDLAAAAERARLEGGVPQRVGAEVALGRAGFADDTCPVDALVAVPDGRGGYAVGDTVASARASAAKVQGRSTSLALAHPVAVPEGPWVVELATTWVEPGYVEPDASWCAPGGEPTSSVANGGAFGGKLASSAPSDARRLADQLGRTVRVLWSREDVVRQGPKRPPVAGGIDAASHGVLRVGVPPAGVGAEVWAGVCAAVAAVAPGLEVEPVPLDGPAISFDLRAAAWAEAAVLVACGRALGAGPPTGTGTAEGTGRSLRDVPVEVVAPDGGRAVARCRADDSMQVIVDAGAPLDQVVLRSYAIGATHQALGWVRSEGIAVDEKGEVRDLTIRSFGILQARAMPPVDVSVVLGSERPPVNGSDAVFAAVAAARWLADGLPPRWPTDRSAAGRR